jgi:hypothetical protein
MKQSYAMMMGLILFLLFVSILQSMKSSVPWESFQNQSMSPITGDDLWSKGYGNETDGEKRYKTFKPYLHQREVSSLHQVDNHEYPINSEMNGAFFQELNKPPVVPCQQLKQ